MQSSDFIINRSDLQQSDWVNSKLPDVSALQEAEVLFKIDSFALTANNITYAVVGEEIGYWQFFPAKEGWGRIPAWGFANVLLSNHSDIQVGERFYGYFPMSSHVLVKAGEVKETGFADTIPHRLALPPIYNFYAGVKNDPLYSQVNEDFQMLFRPLFTTSFLLDDFLAGNHFFEAKSILILSASGKTAIGMAFLLAQRKKEQKLDYQLIGLTSSGNVDFVKSLNIYDKILSYDEINKLSAEATCIVDFSGNHSLQAQIQDFLQENLKYNCRVGVVHWEQRKDEEKLNNKGSWFFAPTQMQKRIKELSFAGFQQVLAKSWLAFLPATKDWLEIKNEKAENSLATIYLKMLEGKISPKEGYVFSF